MYAVHTVAYCFFKKMNARLRVHFKILVILLVHVERVERYILNHPVVWNKLGELGKCLLTSRYVKREYTMCSGRRTPLASCEKNASESYMHICTILGGCYPVSVGTSNAHPCVRGRMYTCTPFSRVRVPSHTPPCQGPTGQKMANVWGLGPFLVAGQFASTKIKTIIIPDALSSIW